MDINTLLDTKTETFEVVYRDQTVTFEAKSDALTPRLMQSFADLREKPIEIANALGSVLVRRDIDLDGQPFPPTAENLAGIPVPFLTAIIEKLGESWSGNAQPLPRSQNGLAVAAK